MTHLTQLKEGFLDDIVEAPMEEIPAELILNCNQTGIKLVPCSSWTMEKQGEKQVEMVGANDKRQITAVFCGPLLGDFLPGNESSQEGTSYKSDTSEEESDDTIKVL